MADIKVKQSFRHDDKLFQKDKTYNITEFDIDTIIKLNERGYIEKLSYDELVKIQDELKGKEKKSDLKKNDDILKNKEIL